MAARFRSVASFSKIPLKMRVGRGKRKRLLRMMGRTDGHKVTGENSVQVFFRAGSEERERERGGGESFGEGRNSVNFRRGIFVCE